MVINPKVQIGLALILFVAYCVLPDAFSRLQLLYGYASRYPLIYPLLINGLFSCFFIWLLPFKHIDYGLRFAGFEWKKILLITFCIQVFPFTIFLLLLNVNDLYLSSWMVLSLFEIVTIYLVLSPLVEELFFRGLIQIFLSPLLNFNLSIKNLIISVPVLITTILFTVIHFTYSVISMIFIFSLGLLCGYLREKHKSLAPAIFAHFVFNLFAVFVPKLILMYTESKY